MSASRLLLASLCACLGACAARQAAPLKSYSLGMARAEYRDYSGTGNTPCDAEPRWLIDELSSVNGLLSRFLSSTEQASDPKALHHTKHLALLQEAERTLGPVLEIHRQNLAELNRCAFQDAGAFQEIARRGAELLKSTKARLVDAPAALAAAEELKRQQQWQDQAPQRQAAAKETWCAAKPAVGKAELYFARQSLKGRMEWFFCDGLLVEAAAGSEPQLILPEGISRQDRRRIQPQRYLDAARAYPASEIDRHPGLAESSSGGPADQASAAD